MEMKGLFNIVSWLYISWVCDVVCRWIVKSFKNIHQKQIEDEITVNINLESSSAPTEAESSSVIEPEKTQKDSAPKPCLAGKLFNCFSKSKTPVFGENTDLSRVHSEAEWRNDPNIKEGLSRVDRVTDGGNTKVTSYYDQTGKLVYQKENQLTTPPPKEPSFISLDSGEKFRNPAFYIKPQPSGNDQNKLSGYKTKVGEDIDLQFQDMYSTAPKDFTESVKTKIDEDIDKTFKEVYDMFSPTLF